MSNTQALKIARDALLRLDEAFCSDDYGTREGRNKGRNALVAARAAIAAIDALAQQASVPSAADDIAAKLRDPVAVHVAMLRGEIAKPALRDMLHLYGEAVLQRWDSVPSVEPPTLADVLDALEVFNRPKPSEDDGPWEGGHYIRVDHLPKFIHNVVCAWYTQPAASASASDQAQVIAAASVAGLVHNIPSEWRHALRQLAFMARTSGGTAGPDRGLMEALLRAEKLLSEPYLPTATPPAAPAPTVQPLSDAQILECVRSVGLIAPMGLTRDHGPYEVTAPTLYLSRLVRAIELEHGITAAPTKE